MGSNRSDGARTREALLDAAERLFAAQGVTAVSLRAVVEAMVAPFLRMLADETRGGDAVTFLARAAAEPGMSLERHAPPAFWDMIQRVAMLLRRVLPGLPERVVLLRVRFLIQQCFVLVTELQRLAGDATRRPRPRELESIGADFVDYLVGGLPAPAHADG